MSANPPARRPTVGRVTSRRYTSQMRGEVTPATSGRRDFMRPLRGFFVFVVSALNLTAAPEPPLRVVTLNTVLTEIAQQVGGDAVRVEGIIRPGIDPHAFEPSAADMRILSEADLILASGLQLESYPDRLVSHLGKNRNVALVGDHLPIALNVSPDRSPPSRRDTPSTEREIDPHWWHSLENVSVAADLVRSELTKLRPEFQKQFSERASAYRTRLLELKSWADTEFRHVPPAQRYLITSHDAFGYLAHDYGLEVHAISGLSTEGEPNAKHLAALIDLIRRKKIRAVFAENDVNPKVIANLVDETGVKLGGTLYPDGLGPIGSDADTYEAMYRHNVRTIVDGLRE